MLSKIKKMAFCWNPWDRRQKNFEILFHFLLSIILQLTDRLKWFWLIIDTKVVSCLISPNLETKVVRIQCPKCVQLWNLVPSRAYVFNIYLLFKTVNVSLTSHWFCWSCWQLIRLLVKMLHRRNETAFKFTLTATSISNHFAFFSDCSMLNLLHGCLYQL